MTSCLAGTRSPQKLGRSTGNLQTPDSRVPGEGSADEAVTVMLLGPRVLPKVISAGPGSREEPNQCRWMVQGRLQKASTPHLLPR